MASVTIDNVTKSFGETQVLKGVSLDIGDGEFVSLVGPSGCGKSTLLRIIAGLEASNSGSISIDGSSVNGLRAADRNLSMVFQSYALYPHLTVEENIAVPLKMRQLSGLQRLPLLGGFMPGAKAQYRSIGKAVRLAAETLNIEQLLQRKPGQLSGGQRQRVAVGRALVRKPQAFLLDEPLSNLDAKLRVHTRTEIAQLHRQLAATFIYVTHDQAEALTMSDRIAVMMDGEILQVASPDEIYNRPTDIRVAEFIGLPKINIIKGDASADGAISYNGRPIGLTCSLRNTPVQLGIRPEHLTFFEPQHAAAIEGEISHMENLGSEAFIHVVVDGQAKPLIARTGPSSLFVLQIGQPCSFSFKPKDTLVFDASGTRLDTKLQTSTTIKLAAHA